MKYYIIFGPPGAGKGTQSYLLAEKFKLKHISTGELLRKELEQKTELGLLAKSIMESGQLVDDNTILEIIKKEICADNEEVKGFILDGFSVLGNFKKNLACIGNLGNCTEWYIQIDILAIGTMTECATSATTMLCPDMFSEFQVNQSPILRITP